MPCPICGAGLYEASRENTTLGMHVVIKCTKCGYGTSQTIPFSIPTYSGTAVVFPPAEVIS